LLRLRETYGAARLEAACVRAQHFADQRYTTIKRILVEGLDTQLTPELAASPPPVARTFARSAADLLGHLFGGL
jgi:hypothetical protein